MKKVALLMVVALLIGLSAQVVLAQDKQEPKKDAAAVSVAGKWNMSVEGPQGAMSVAMTLVVDGTKVTGTLSSQMGDTQLEGQWVDGTLTFAISFEGGSGTMQIGFTGKLKDENTLNGSMSGPMGEMPWTAVRVKE
jgi:quinohemoprotein ethanol dehydrogenase